MIISKLHTRKRGSAATTTSCPRRKLCFQSLFVALLVLIMPLVSPSGVFIAAADEYSDTEGLLAIDSPTFVLDSIAMTEDGFLIKSAGQTAATDRSNLSDIITYTVEEGDSLSSIAYRFGISMDTIAWENSLSNRHNLKVGSQLAILPVSGITHDVKTGDTLASLAKKYKLDVEKLAKQNQLTADTPLLASAKVIIPGGRKTIATSGNYIASTSAPGTYAAYRAPTAVDGAVIIANGQADKSGKWMIKPTVGVYTTYFGARRGHWAVDIADASQPGIQASADGTVVKSQCGWNGGYGCMVVIDHGDGFQTLYAHMSKLYAGVGEKVKQGTQIGKMGNTGRSYGKTGIHLHFEVIDNGRKKNPLAFY